MRIIIYTIFIVVAVVLVIIFFDDFYFSKPISTKAELSSSTVAHGQMIVVSVEAKNRSFRKFVVIPGYHRLRGPSSSMDGVGFFFKQDGSDYHPNFRYMGLMLDPIWDKLQPRETRRYEFYWQPSKSDKGDGSLFLTLPDDFEPVKPFKVKVIQSSESGPRE